MKRLLLLCIVLISATGFAKAQTNHVISLKASNGIKEIVFRPDVLPDGRKIAYFSILKSMDMDSNIQSDSLVFVSSTQRKLVLSRVYRINRGFDNLMEQMECSYILNDDDVEFLKKNTVSKIAVTIGGEVKDLKLRPSSSSSLSDIANANF